MSEMKNDMMSIVGNLSLFAAGLSLCVFIIIGFGDAANWNLLEYMPTLMLGGCMCGLSFELLRIRFKGGGR